MAGFGRSRGLRGFLLAGVLAGSLGSALASGNTNFLLGRRFLATGEESLESVEEQPFLGVNIDIKAGELPFSWVAGVHLSYASDSGSSAIHGDDATLGIGEVSFGVHWTRPSGRARPYTAEGLTEVAVFDEDGNKATAAFFAEAGLNWRSPGGYNLGVGVRMVEGANISIEEEYDANYIQVGVLFGFQRSE